MIRFPATAVAIALAVWAPARAQSVAKEPPKDWRRNLQLEVGTFGGAFDGYGTLKESGGVAVLEAKGSPTVFRDGWWLDVPFRIGHRQTFGASLSDTTGAIDLEPWFVVSESVRLGLEAGLYGRWAPDWPDQYQPNGAGGLQPTDRFSYAAFRAGAAVYARPAPHQHLRARYRFVSQDYKTDPNFDPNNPTHLTPRSNDRHELDVHWRYTQRLWALALRLDYAHRNETELLARDAGTGSTSGGTNPLQVTNLWEPSAELEVRDLLGGILELSVGYGYDVQEDTFQGYYSFTQHHPRASARVELTKRLTATARYEGWFRTYGPNGTSQWNTAHTIRKLEYGTRRVSTKFLLGGDVAYALGGGVLARATFEYVDRATNYYDYVPGVTSTYDIDWDYTNVSVVAGLEYRM